MFLNQFLFFVFRSHVLVVWDYKNHRQYEFNAAYVKRLLEIVENPKSFDEENPMDLDLLNNGILLKEETSPEYGGGTIYQKYFMWGPKIYLVRLFRRIGKNGLIYIIGTVKV